MTESNISGTRIPAGELEKPSTRGKAIEGTQATMSEPSAAWGWSGAFPHGTRIAGWLLAVLMLVLAFFGNHRGHVEEFWLAGIAIGMVAILVRDIVRRRHAWRR